MVEGKEIKKSSRRTCWLLSILITVVIVAVCSYGFQLWQETQSKIRQLNLVTKVMLTQNYTKQLQLENKVSLLQKNISRMSNSKVEVYQVTELVALANQMLVVYGDISSTIRLLNLAKNQLVTTNDPIFEQLKLALGYDITRLSLLNNIDSAELNGNIDAITEQISQMQLQPKLNDSDSATKISLSLSKWDRFVLNFKQTLAHLIKISPQQHETVLLPKSEDALKINIKIDLLNAKIALLNRDQTAWQYNLHEVITSMNHYFYNYPNFTAINASLNKLVQINLANDRANIDKTLLAINKLKLLTNP